MKHKMQNHTLHTNGYPLGLLKCTAIASPAHGRCFRSLRAFALPRCAAGRRSQRAVGELSVETATNIPAVFFQL